MSLFFYNDHSIHENKCSEYLYNSFYIESEHPVYHDANYGAHNGSPVKPFLFAWESNIYFIRNDYIVNAF